MKKKLAAQRWIDAENDYHEYIPTFSEEPIEEIPEMDELPCLPQT